MEITTELLKTIYERVAQVFNAKTGFTPDKIKMYEEGSFYASKRWSIAYGGTEEQGIHICAEDLTVDLDELVKERKANEEAERVANEKIQKDRQLKYEEEQKQKRQQQYLELKKEFDHNG